ncbi:MAG: tetratricopeptide repeat protein [Trueperaceae bacterium]|nr:tetratricopeptide repeat protein [Trueperaceae bacterium]
MRNRIIVVLVGLWLAAFTLAQPSLALYPFSSQETLLGVAVTERVASAVDDAFEVFGPVETPVLVPPLVVESGFLNPLFFVGNDPQALNVDSLDGAAVVREALGVDAVLTGDISFVGGRLELDLYLAHGDDLQRYLVTAPEDEPGRLAARVVDILERRFDVSADPDAVYTIDLSTAYGEYVRALALTSGGFLSQAQAALDVALSAEEAEPAWQGLEQTIAAVLRGDESRDPRLGAAIALSAPTLGERDVISYFERFAEASDSLLPQVWLGSLKSSVNDRAGANAAFDQAASYPYGFAARTLYRLSNDLAGGTDDLAELLTRETRSALIAALLGAQQEGDVELEKAAARQLIEVAPRLTYPYERLSFIAFDQDEPLEAAKVLRVATALAPDSDLYWTNLGWSYYLLGRLELSEQASLRAVELSAEQFIAWYNLGLARTVTDRLGDAMDAYAQALSRDPDVDDEAIIDLENALDLYPDQAGVHYALARLYEAEGRDDDAETQYELYLERGDRDTFVREANQRLEALRAPPPPIEIVATGRLGLGPELVAATPFRPGDRIFTAFELSTPGFELPRDVVVGLSLLPGDAPTETGETGTGDAIRTLTEEVNIPSDAVALTIDGVGIDLPNDLAAGSYVLDVRVSADEDREATQRYTFEVAGEPSLLRQLVSRDISLRDLETGAPLYRPRDVLEESVDDAALVDTLLGELRNNVDTAAEVLPTIDEGRFEGLGGGELFAQSDAEDIRDFLDYILGQGETSNATFSFVDAYAQWAVDGAPAE